MRVCVCVLLCMIACVYYYIYLDHLGHIVPMGGLFSQAQGLSNPSLQARQACQHCLITAQLTLQHKSPRQSRRNIGMCQRL
jgi:hypothetical protein